MSEKIKTLNALPPHHPGAVLDHTTRNCLDELGLGYLPSHTNFLMHPIEGDVKVYIARMRDRGLHVGRPFPALPSYNRLSMGLPEEMAVWAEALRDFREQGWV